MAKKKVDEKQYWTKLKKKSPKYPDFTCPSVDDILERIAKVQSKQKLSQWQHKLIIKRMEELRTDNEQLRESGRYWHETCKTTVEDMFDLNKESKWKKK